MNAPDPETEPSPASSGRRAFAQDLPWLLLLLGAVLWNLVRMFGHSPGIWVDTLIENLFVDDCLDKGRCTTVGAGATVGIFHSAGYFSWRSLLHWLGWHANGTYRVFLFINALGVTLTALAARRIATRTAGAAAALLMVLYIGVPTQLDVITDLVPMPFLGAVFTLAALTAVTNPNYLMTAMLGLIAGVAGNFYATGLLLGTSGFLVALMMPRRRWLHALIVTLTFAVSTFALSPGTWIINARILLTRSVGNANKLYDNPVFGIPHVQLAGVAVALWIAASIVRASSRRGLHVMAAIVLPLFIPIVLGSKLGRLDAQPKYVAHVISAACVGVAVPLTEVLRWAWVRIARFRPTISGYLSRFWDFSVPYAVCVVIGLGIPTRDDMIAGRTIIPYNYSDVEAAERAVADHGWSWAKAARNLRAPDEIVRRAAVRWVRWPEKGQDDQQERAYLLKMPNKLVPRPLPPGVVEARTTDRTTTLVDFACSWIDWTQFRACTRDSPTGEETCVDSGLPADPEGHSDNDKGVPGMPVIDGRSFGTHFVTLHFRMQPRASCPEQWVYMPRQAGICAGRIVSIDGTTNGIEDNGRWLRLKQSADGSAPHELAIEWEVGGTVCSVEYRGFPPFFVEGDPTAVTYLSTALERQWKVP